MGKTKQPKSARVREIPSEKDIDASMQDAPRAYRQVKRFMDLLDKKEVEKVSKTLKTTKKTTQESLDDLRTVVNQTAKRQTKKYEKRKSFLSLKKEKSTPKDNGLELVDHIKFGERVEAPPKITIIPKQKGYIKQVKVIAKPKQIQEKRFNTEPIGDQSIGRKKKLKELPEADRNRLLQERQRLIDHYRSKKRSF